MGAISPDAGTEVRLRTERVRMGRITRPSLGANVKILARMVERRHALARLQEHGDISSQNFWRLEVVQYR